MKMEKHWVPSLLLLSSVAKLFVFAHPDANETQHSPQHVYSELGVTRNKIVTAQFECYQKIMKDTDYNKKDYFITSDKEYLLKLKGPLCNRTWDGWLCWDDTPAGMTSVQRCPDYFQDFDPSEKVTKICDENGNWFSHPESNRTWTNYTRCTAHTPQKVKTALNQYYLTIIGHGLSIASLLISLGIFFYFKSLSCQRITLHKNLFFSFVSNSIITIIWLTAVANNQPLVARNPVSCKVSQFIHLYLMGCNYFWMLCEGIYLHTLIVVAVFAEKQHLMWYYLLGWGFPLIPASIHAIARSLYYNDNCWISSETHLLYIIHGPICTALLVNLFFLLNIVRVLITKLKVTHQAESSLYMKAVRATLILVPLLGIQFVLFPWKPQGRVAEELYDYVMNILMHYQGLLVATIFCFFNGEVQAVLRRHWNQYRIQFGNSFSHTDTLRSASYTVSSITDVHGSMYSNDCHSEHLNGKGSHDIDTIALKSENTYA
ncbi:calcitonin gene-related peptide type 1 receptor-like isoform X1 [Acipenser ruthenus]|uniref:calcitonin gene-related peptide type 1 receptor-like isoform X1 n=1 Tax=Acipenser ruthenus TaxID=7906 RepID=UPI00145B4B23|nr:calcitonin gene-related peptide type 1 receptor-like isoform X1 [Acipenser ruthenus]XP_033865757.1 calcitonin gene-related peptide type 1 receptor-like isoform X1 [Acipenser ruthenus]XP_058888167.1 calcitonin gene-related peptide type 1 receptor-like isoform X1 [Acipenser ruthenus]